MTLVCFCVTTAEVATETMYMACKGLPGGAYIAPQTESSPWSSECLVIHVCSALNNLSCDMIIIYKIWGKSQKPWDERG